MSNKNVVLVRQRLNPCYLTLRCQSLGFALLL